MSGAILDALQLFISVFPDGNNGQKETWLLLSISLQQSNATVLIFGFIVYKEEGQYFFLYASFILLLKLIVISLYFSKKKP